MKANKSLAGRKNAEYVKSGNITMKRDNLRSEKDTYLVKEFLHLV